MKPVEMLLVNCLGAQGDEAIAKSYLAETVSCSLAWFAACHAAPGEAASSYLTLDLRERRRSDGFAAWTSDLHGIAVAAVFGDDHQLLDNSRMIRDFFGTLATHFG